MNDRANQERRGPTRRKLGGWAVSMLVLAVYGGLAALALLAVVDAVR